MPIFRIPEKQVYETFKESAQAKGRLLRRWTQQGFTSGIAYNHLRMNAASYRRCAREARLLLWKARLMQMRFILNGRPL